MNDVGHSFNPALFRELRGLVSRKALNMILEESKRANDTGINIALCKCVIKSTHGLPCAHEIAECKRDFLPIPLSSVHSNWMKLNLQKSQPSSDSLHISIDDEMNAIWSRFHSSNQTGKLTLKRKLRKLGNPATTFLTPPLEKPKTKGRPQSKKSGSTCRDPSFFEIVETTISKHEAELCEKTVTSKKRAKLPVRRSIHVMHYLNSFPSYIQPYVRSISDVKSDGHCGFRAIAGLLGFGEDCWSKVREELIEELCNYRSYYVKLYGTSKAVVQLLDALSCFTSTAPFENWMDLPDMGHLVATRYNVILIHISKEQCLTFLPLRSNPPLQPQLKIITIGLVYNSHFVQILLDHSAPMPPIVTDWKHHRFDAAAGWNILF